MIFDAVVVGFDDVRGDGTLRDDRGREFYVHCVAIVDGTRHLDVGAAVRARRVVGRRGRDEAADVVTR